MHVFRSLHDNKVLLIIVISLIATFIIDISFLRTYDLVPKSLLLNHGVGIFIIIVIVYSIGQYLVLMILRYRIDSIKSKNRTLFLVDKGIMIVQYVLLTSLAVIVFQILVFREFSTHILSFSIAVSFGMGAFNLAVLGKLFLSWFRQNTQGTLIFYSLSSITVSIFAIITSVFVYLTLSYKPQAITPFLGGSTIYIPAYSVANVLGTATFILSIVSFLLTWIATFFLLKPYSRKVGEIKFVLVISLPLVFFIVQFPVQFSDSIVMIITSGTTQYAIILTLVFTFIKLLGAIMFGISFWIVVKNLDPNLPIRSFMAIAGIGFVFLFITNQSSAIVVAPYPPYGLTTFLFFALSSYLVLSGVYGSAISMAEDSRLRKTVRNFVKSKLLEDIGLASVQKEIYDRSEELFKKYKDGLFENEGLNTSLSENEIRSYVEEVVRIRESELKKRQPEE